MPPTDLPQTHAVTGIVLAGGKSSRMGRPKALLPFDGTPLVARVVRTLGTLFNDVVIVAAREQDLPPLPGTLVRDVEAFQGPAAGLCHGLRAARWEICFVTSCDAAFPCVPLIAHLVSRLSAAHDVVVPSWRGQLQPLHAVYRRSVLPQLESQVARGELRLVDLFARVRTLRVEEAEIRRFDPDGASFFNVNSPEDYAEALRRGAVADPEPPVEDSPRPGKSHRRD